MSVARIRCTACRGYFDRAEIYREAALSRVCSEECWSVLLDRRRRKSIKRTAPRKRRPGMDLALRKEVRQRDGDHCRFCGVVGQQVHHIVYRSSGGPDEPSNLILLCAECHAIVHSSKRSWQPLLLGVLWMHYVHGKVLSVPQFKRWYEARFPIAA